MVTGVWGSAFSILFNRVLGVKDTAGGSTMEEELGNIDIILKILMDFFHLNSFIPFVPSTRSVQVSHRMFFFDFLLLHTRAITDLVRY